MLPSPHRVLPVVFFALGIGYLVFALGLDARTMPGDPGYDPGPRAVPILSGIVLSAIALALILRDTVVGRAPAETGAGDDAMAATDRGVAVAVFIHIAVGVGFLAGFRSLGFVAVAAPALAVMLLTNRWLANRQSLRWHWVLVPPAASVISLAVMAGLQALGRLLSQTGLVDGGALRAAILIALLAGATALAVRMIGHATARDRLSILVVSAVAPPLTVLVVNGLFATRLPVWPAFVLPVT